MLVPRGAGLQVPCATMVTKQYTRQRNEVHPGKEEKKAHVFILNLQEPSCFTMNSTRWSQDDKSYALKKSAGERTSQMSLSFFFLSLSFMSTFQIQVNWGHNAIIIPPSCFLFFLKKKDCKNERIWRHRHTVMLTVYYKYFPRNHQVVSTVFWPRWAQPASVRPLASPLY